MAGLPVRSRASGNGTGNLRMLSRRGLLAISFSAALMLGAQPSRAAVDPGVFIQGLADQAIATASSPMPQSAKVESFRTMFVSTFDLPGISRFILGRYWRGATPEQKQEFIGAFEELSVLTWTRRFNEYQGLSLVVTGVKEAPDGLISVGSRIMRGQGDPVVVTWRLSRAEGGYQIVDIVVEGVSMALTHRSEYTSALQSLGGKVDRLIAVMRDKIAMLRSDISRG